MTPKEKAEEICRKMLFQIEWNAQPSVVKGAAKQCALIAVDEIIQSNPCKLDGFEYERNTKYWEDVKQEIEKL
jgi:hypothetical protein